MTRPSTAWMAGAACLGLDGRDGRADFLEARVADQLGMCAWCPVAVQCLDYARATGATDVVMGGVVLRSRPLTTEGT
ncbi:WhiB family transcriptional regulator [Propionibacteriaceae bacterium G57]|uniref:WhiB family transcriptional regulator n=1 Tax=Aestuariimicrobium sp. G57 TaxID=3418485 RepID=UPI003DA7A237